MSRTKLQRFQIISERRNVIEPQKALFHKVRGNWGNLFFRNQHDIIVEVGCGKGEYTIGMANLFPNKNFIGIDIKGSRIWKGSTVAEENGLQNVAFLRNFVENLNENFAAGEVSELWITFPDPRPRLGEAKKRLTSERFLNLYESLVKKGGIIHFKTDCQNLFDFTLELLKKRKASNLKFTYDLYTSELQHHTLNIQTTYEKRFLAEGVTIKYLQYTNT